MTEKESSLFFKAANNSYIKDCLYFVLDIKSYKFEILDKKINPGEYLLLKNNLVKNPKFIYKKYCSHKDNKKHELCHLHYCPLASNTNK